MKGFVFFNVLFVLLSSGSALAKLCTNAFPELSSHTFRYELLSSKNETWKQEMFTRYHLTPAHDYPGLLPRKLLNLDDEFNWASLTYREVKNPGKFELPRHDFLKAVSLHDVRLDSSSLHWRAQQTNLEYLLMLDVDRLAWSFRKTAGLSTPGQPYGGWEAPNCELRGHFVGHYLSATAQMWASTHNDTLKDKMSALVSTLSDCQKQMGTGYLSAFPTELFDRVEALKPVWAPYYTIHKILAGLLDQYTLAGNNQALKMATWMVNYFHNRVMNVITKYSVERHFQSLNEETGGMNDVLYQLFSITRDPEHLLLAHLFDKPCFLGLLAVQANDITGFHSNTHIPVVIGAQRRYEVTGDKLYKEMGIFFMDIINSSHSYATGGTSSGEFWQDPKRMATTLETENQESCTTYNMLKVSRHLFTWTKDMAYADYYERALTNSVIGNQRGTEPGVMIYMVPLRGGGSKAISYHGWGTKFDSFWCCYGTGVESFSKLGDSIYFEEEGKVPGLYIIQYISSSFNWKTGRFLLNQTVDPVVSSDPYLRLTLTLTSNKVADQSSLNLRIPYWTLSSGYMATLNGQSLSLSAPGNFLSVTRKWRSGDKITLQLPMTLRTEAIKDDRPEYASLQAILCGPYLLAGYTSGDSDIKIDSASSPSEWITPIPASYNANLFSFFQGSGDATFVLTNSNQSITMEKVNISGTDAALHATFRLILRDSSSSHISSVKDIIGKSVVLEPIDFPGMAVVQQGREDTIVVRDASTVKSSIFRLVSGLDGKDTSVSLESEIQKGCFVHGGASVKLRCSSKPSNAQFNAAASFAIGKGMSQYHPISFVAKGVRRNFLLAPLYSFRDESYTVYFNMHA